MTDLAKRIAVLLANYEMDEPHFDLEGNVVYGLSATFPELALQEWAGAAHHGDCLKEPGPCLRCMASEWLFKGQWIAACLEKWK